MGFSYKIKQAFEMLTFNEQAISNFSKDKTNTKFAHWVLVILGLAFGFGFGIFTGPLVIIFMIIGVITMIAGVWIVALLYHLLALLFGGKGKLIEYFRAYASLYEIQWIMAIPILGLFLSGVAGLWIFIVNVSVLKNVYKLSTVKSLFIVFIPLIISIVLLLTGIISLVNIPIDTFAPQPVLE
jgi:hypothetical protein